MKIKRLLSFLLFPLLFLSCEDEPEVGTLNINFTHYVDQAPIQLNQMIYTNAALNPYQVNEIKYFISKVYLITDENEYVEIEQEEGIHYVDLNYSNTTSWNINNLEEGEYKAIQFVFGLDEEDNTSNRFPNSPECNFFWPQHLGGGYHYMQINGKWQPPTGDLKNFNFHTGIGQLYYSNVLAIDSIYAYVHNYISITVPAHFVIKEAETSHLEFRMNVEQWFKDPYDYDFNYFGSSIMQNQNAQSVIKANGRDVFEIIPLLEE
ncbi:MAG TPA: hypothetical protein PKG88_03800 [Bacteroidales bacterium]|nr:hypothetical protein [Bacteroidales bacterium]HPS72330.1 hypothetical protein [Bacteroidales bacterium]